MPQVKAVIYAEPADLVAAASIARTASEKTDWSKDGFTIYAKGEQHFHVKKNKAGLTVWGPR